MPMIKKMITMKTQPEARVEPDELGQLGQSLIPGQHLEVAEALQSAAASCSGRPADLARQRRRRSALVVNSATW